jgi:hypothetical protein
MKKLQKSISIATSITTTLWLSGVAMLAPMSVMAADIVDGDLIRNPNAEGMAQFDIYIVKLVGEKKFKRLILSPHVFESYEHFDKNGNGTPWDDVVDVDQATMDQYTTSDLVRADGDTRVYKLVAEEGSDTGTKEWLNMTAEEFEAAGYDWDSIYVINATDRDAYTVGEEVTAGVEEEAAEGENVLTIALAADTPAAGFAIKNSTRVGFTKVNFTAGSEDVTITSLKVQRTGSPASDGAFSGVNILKPDGDLLSASYKTLNSAHQATFTEDIVVPANTTVSYTLVGKMADSDSYAGEVPKLALVEVNTTADLNATLPIEGNAMTINTTINIADLAISESPDVGEATKEVGTSDYDFVNVKLTNSASDADIQIESIKFNNVGSADDADVANMKLLYYTTGEVIATAEMVSNYIYFDLSDCGDTCKIGKGKNKTFTLRGDIIGGSARTLDFDIKKVEHVVAKDLLNDVYITPSGEIDYGNIVTISRGKLNVNKTDTIKAGNIADNSSDVELGSWNFKVTGESITVSKIKFDIDVNGTVQAADFTNLVLINKTTGETLTGGTDGSGSGDGSVTFTDSFTLPIGDNEIVITGTINSDPVADDTVQFAVDFSSVSTDNLDATGDETGDAITIGTYATPEAEIDANILTFKDLSLAVTTLSQPAARTLAAGTSGIHYSTISFDATDSSEDVKVTSFQINIVTNGTAKTNEIQNIKFVVDGTELSVTKNGSDSDAGDDEEITVSLTGDDQFIVKKGTTATMKIYADLAAGATAGGTHRIDMDSGREVVSSGAVSGNDVTETYSSATANAVTVGTPGGTVEVSLASSNPSGGLFAAGTTGVTLAAFKFYATSTEDVELDYLYLTQVVTNTNSSSYKDYDRIYFEDENGVEVAGTSMTPTSTFPRINFADGAFVVDIDDTDGAVLYLKADLAAIGTGSNGVAGHYLGYKINAQADVVATGALTGSGSYEYLSSGSAPTGNTHYVYKGYPTFARVALDSNALSNGEKDLYKFTVTANSSDVALYGFTFNIATTGCTVTNLYLYDVTTDTEVQVNDTAGTCSASDCTWQTVGSDWTTNFSGREIVVSTAQAHTFVLRGSVAGASSGDSVTTRVAGDAAHISVGGTLMDAADDVDSDSHDDFIWSDKSQGAHTYQTDDWTNGYLVPGLSSTYSTSEVLSL